MNGLAALLLVMLLASIVFASASMSAIQVISHAGSRASAVFARRGEMGTHASQQPAPRVGLGNLARLLFEQGLCRMTACRRWARLSQISLV